MANNNAELKAFTGVHNETLKGGAHCVAPWAKGPGPENWVVDDVKAMHGLLVQAPRRQQDANNKSKTNQVISTYHESLQGRKIMSERRGTCNCWGCQRWQCWRWRCRWRIMRIMVVFLCMFCAWGELWWTPLNFVMHFLGAMSASLCNWKINLLTYVCWHHSGSDSCFFQILPYFNNRNENHDVNENK